MCARRVWYIIARMAEVFWVALLASRGDAAGWAWRRSGLWRERVRDDGVVSATLAAALATALYSGVVGRVLVSVLFIVYMFVAIRIAVWRGRLLSCKGGRRRRRWRLGFHGLLRLAMLRQSSTAGWRRYTEADGTTGRSCYRAGGDFPQERQDCGYIQLALSRPWEKVLGLALYTRARAKGWAPHSSFADANQRPPP